MSKFDELKKGSMRSVVKNTEKSEDVVDKVYPRPETSSKEKNSSDLSAAEEQKPVLKQEEPKEKRVSAKEKSVLERTTIHKVTVPVEKRNNVVTKGISLDQETYSTLSAYVEVLRGSGAKMDNRPITVSSFCRYALIHEFERIEKLNGEQFIKEVEKVKGRVPEEMTSFIC